MILLKNASVKVAWTLLLSATEPDSSPLAVFTKQDEPNKDLANKCLSSPLQTTCPILLLGVNKMKLIHQNWTSVCLSQPTRIHSQCRAVKMNESNFSRKMVYRLIPLGYLIEGSSEHNLFSSQNNSYGHICDGGRGIWLSSWNIWEYGKNIGVVVQAVYRALVWNLCICVHYMYIYMCTHTLIALLQ